MELGFETISFSSRLTGTKPDPVRLVRAAKAAGFTWISFDRTTLAEQAARQGGLAALSEACRAHALPCRAVQSLVQTADPAADGRADDRLTEHVAALTPDVVPVILTAAPTANLRGRIARLLDLRPTLRFAVEFGPVFAVGTPDDALRVVDRLGEPRVGLLLDSWHAFTGATTWRQLHDLDAERIALVQLSDSGPAADRYHRLLPGDGGLPIAPLLALLEQKSYTGPISVEVISAEPRTLTPEDYARKAMAAVVRCHAAARTSFCRLGNRSGTGRSGNSRRHAISDGWAT